MKAIKDEDLSPTLLHTQTLAKEIAHDQAQKIIAHLQFLFVSDEKFEGLSYSGMMTFINTLASHMFGHFFMYSCHIGKQFKDADHSSRDLFEEVLKGLRILVKFPEINEKEHSQGIKKVAIKE